MAVIEATKSDSDILLESEITKGYKLIKQTISSVKRRQLA